MKCFIAIGLFVVGLFGFHGIASPQEKAPAPVAKAPQPILGSVTIVDLVPHKGVNGNIGKPLGEIDEQDFTGPLNKVMPQISNFLEEGRAIGVRKLSFAIVDNQDFHASNTEMKWYLSDVEIRPKGKTASKIAEKVIGTTSIGRAQIGNDKVVTIDLTLSDSRPFPPEIGVVGIGKDKFVYGARPRLDAGLPAFSDGAGKELQVYDFVTHKLKANLKIPLGHAVVAKDIEAQIASFKGERSPCPPQIMVIVSTQVDIRMEMKNAPAK